MADELNEKLPIDKEYLISSLKDFDKYVLSKKYTNGVTYEPKIGKVTVVDKIENTNVKVTVDNDNKNIIFDFSIPQGRSIKNIEKDENDDIVIKYTDDTEENIGKLEFDISGDFLTTDGIGNLRYYNGHFQYFDKNLQEWIDTVATPDNVLVVNMVPNPMRLMLGIYDYEYGHYKLKWQEPADTVVEGQLICAVEKVVIRRKLGETPKDENDGDLVKVIERKDFGNQSDKWYMDIDSNPKLGDVYYYKAFPMSTTGFYNYSTGNETGGLLAKNYFLFGLKIDQGAESNPASMISYLEDNINFRSAYMDYTLGTFNYGDWGDFWFIRDIKPCMLNYDGTVAYELNPNDYTKKKDGTDSDVANADFPGNVMVGIPKTYWKIVGNGDDMANIYFSNKKVDDDFVCWSHIDNNGNRIPYCYMPAYNGSIIGNKLRSLSGKTPTASKTVQQETNCALANNLTDDVIWYTEVFCDRMLINLLSLLIGKSADTQTVFGKGNVNSYVSESNTGVKACGIMDKKGLFYGETNGKDGVKVFGIEHYWGNIWRRIAGWINDKGIQKFKLTYGQFDGSTVSGYNDNGDGYISIDNLALDKEPTKGYISKMSLSHIGLIPMVRKGSSSTYYCDILSFATSSIYYAVVGGETSYSVQTGAFCSTLNSYASEKYFLYNSSISCKPLATGGTS